DIPSDEAVIIFTFKTRTAKRDTVALLRRSLEDAGVDTRATVEFKGKQCPRIVILTWGQETSLSHFQYARSVVTRGVLERSKWDIAGAIVGQQRDLSAEVTSEEIQDIMLSEA